MKLIDRLRDLGFAPKPPDGTLSLMPLPPETPEQIAEYLRAVQLFHGLDVTGKFDSATERALSAPRFCGCPDLMTLDATNNRWPDPHIHWGFSNNWPVSMEMVRAAIQWACDQWAAVCGVKFTFCETEFPKDARSRMLIECGRIDGQSGTLAWSELANGQHGQKNQKYDAGEKWVDAEKPNNFEIDLARVACHEIGHFIGIPHISQGNLLQPTYDVRIRKPQAGDIREAQARYGKPSPTAPPAPGGEGTEFLIRVNQDASIAVSPALRVVPW